MQEEKGDSLTKESSDFMLCKEGHECSSSGTMLKIKRVSSVSKKSSKNLLPSIHEDYYGPRHHRPTHH